MYIYTGSASPPEMRGSQKGTDVATNARKNGLRRKTGNGAFNRGREWKKKKPYKTNMHGGMCFFCCCQYQTLPKSQLSQRKKKTFKMGEGRG